MVESFAVSSVSLHFIEIISDTLFRAIKLAKSFITQNSFKSTQFMAAVEKCAEHPECISHELLQFTVMYLGDRTCAVLGDSASSIRVAKQ